MSHCAFSLSGAARPLSALLPALFLALFLALACAGGARADALLRPEVARPLQAAQEALKARRPEEALAALEPLQARQDLNEAERATLERASAQAALQARQYARAVPALEWLLQRPDGGGPERPAWLQSVVSASLQLKDYERAAHWARLGWQAGGAEAARFRQVRLQALGLLGRHAEVLAEARAAQAEAGSPPLNEAEWRALGASQLKLKDQAGYEQTLRQLLRLAPSVEAAREYWADLLPRLVGQPGMQGRLELDLYRLYELTGNLEDAAEYGSYAELALKAGLPAEAARIWALGLERQALRPGPDTERLRQARQRAAEDEQALPALRAAARQGEDWAQVAEVLASAQRWEPAAEAYARALALGGLRRPDEVRLHYGRSLLALGRKPQAQEVWAQVGGEAQALAQLWLLYARQTP